MRVSKHPSLAIIGIICAAASLWAPGAQAAPRTIDQHVDADPHGQVEIINVSGRITVIGWEKSEVEVSGTLGNDIDKLDITRSGNRTTVRVVLDHSDERHFRFDLRDPSDANLTVYVPRGSSLSASLVSADISVRDIEGDQELQTVSGDVRSAALRAVRVHTISGDVQLTAGPESALLELGTVSGDLEVTGGHGDVTISTVSGSGKLSLGTLTHARIKSVSGDYEMAADIAADGLLEAQSVSGDVKVNFTHGLPPAEFDLHSFSGDLTTCFGQKAEHEQFGAGARLSFRQGAGSAHVHIDTNSGDVSLCGAPLSSATRAPTDALSALVRAGYDLSERVVHSHPVLARPGNCRLCLTPT